jgi:hypothetical protein
MAYDEIVEHHPGTGIAKLQVVASIKQALI